MPTTLVAFAIFLFTSAASAQHNRADPRKHHAQQTLEKVRTSGHTDTLPTPTGPFGIGTTVITLTDTARHNREITAQLWYPATPSRSTTNAPYLMEHGLVDSLIAQQYYGLDSVELRGWSRAITHSQLNAPPRSGSYPILTLSHGLGVARANYTSLAEELASHGYIVVAVDHPHSGFSIASNGRLVSSDDLSDKDNEAAPTRARINEEAGDLSFVLTRLQQTHTAIGPTIDWTRVGAFGHSSGGLIAVEACQRDPRFRACINLDGGLFTPEKEPLADFVNEGVARPTLFLNEHPLYSDADHAKRGRTREQWEAGGKAQQALLETFANRSRAPLIVASVAGTGHFSFTDGPFMMPTTITRFGGSIIDGNRGWQVITSTMMSFFDSAFNGHPQSALAKPMATYPELSLTLQSR